MNEAYSNLANAIVEKAVEDHRSATIQLRKLKDIDPKQDEAHQKQHEKWEKKINKVKEELQECEEFFLSTWFETLTDLDGSTLLAKVKELEVAA